MSKSAILLTFLITLLMCYSCSTTRNVESTSKSETLFIINNYGRLYEPISLNYFGHSNIDKIATGRDKKSKKGLITVYMKDGVELISFNTFLERNGLTKLHKVTYPVYFDTTLISKPNKLVFVASQKFNIDTIYHDKESNSSHIFILRISLSN